MTSIPKLATILKSRLLRLPRNTTEKTDANPEITKKEERESPESKKKRRKERKLRKRLLSNNPNLLRPRRMPPRGRVEEEEAERVRNDLFKLNHS